MLDEQTAEQYVRDGGTYCPFCKSGNVVSAGPIATDGCEVFQIMCCEDCGKEWKDYYVLDSVKEVPPGKDPSSV